MMKACLVHAVLLILLQWPGVRSQSNDMDTFTSCNSTISIQCPNERSPLIFVCSINTTESPAPLILEKCNAHSGCLVPNADNMCLKVMYKCIADKPKLELKKSAGELRTNSSLFYLMSENYLDGGYQDPNEVNCNLQFGRAGEEESMHFIVQEFATFINSTDYCLQVQNVSQPPYCSGTGKFFYYYGPFRSRLGWNFSLTLDKKASTVPKIRFWLAVVGQAEGSEYFLKCTSSAVAVANMGTLALMLLSLLVSLVQHSHSYSLLH